MRGVTRDVIIGAAIRTSAKVKGRLTLRAMERETGISFTQVYYHFPEGWYGVLRAAGLVERASRRPPVSRHELMADLQRVVAELGRLPKWNELRQRAKYSNAVYLKRYGTMANVWRAFRVWSTKRGVGEVGSGSAGATAGAGKGRATGRACVGENPPLPLPRGGVAHDGRGGEVRLRLTEGSRPRGPCGDLRPGGSCHGQVYGGPLGGRGLVLAPTNEAGVMVLFGAMAAELGFAVLRVQAGFPDCEALRRVEDGKWERVRVEFEFRSGNFALHGHDAAACDLVVCWEHNWEACPVEVLELRRVVGMAA